MPMHGLTYGTRGRRSNPFAHENIRLRIKLLALDGDHALQNNFTVRSNVTIQEMIETPLRLMELPQLTAHWELLELAESFRVSYEMLTDDQKAEVQAKYKEVMSL